MTNTAHTTSPWEINVSGLVYGQCIGDDAEAPFVADVCHQPDSYTEQERANGRLIVAAPELLAACQLIIARWERGDLAEAARACHSAVALATDGYGCPPWELGEQDIHAAMARRRQIADVWSIEDVQSIRSDLSDEQAWEVLQAASRYHDAAIGINWDVLDCHADMLFGRSPKPVDAEED